MPPIVAILWGVVLPFVTAAIGWGVWALLRTKSSLPLQRSSGGLAALVVGGAFAWAFYAVDPMGNFPPAQAVEWPFYSGMGVLLVALLEGLLRPQKNWQRLLFWVPTALMAVIPVSWAWRTSVDVFNPDAGPRFSPLQAWSAVAGWAAAILILRAAAGHFGCRSPKGAIWTLGLLSVITSVILGFSGSQFPQPFRTGSLGLSLLPLLGLLYWQSRKGVADELPAPAITLWVTLTAAVILASYLWYALTGLNASLLLAGLVLQVVVPGKRPVIRTGVALIPALVALTLAAITYAKAESADSYGY